MSEERRIFIIWVSEQPETAEQMAFMYAKNSLLRDWWDRVRLIVWGPSAMTLAENREVQALLPDLKQAGVEVWACKACADRYAVSGKLEKLGLEVLYVGSHVTEMLQGGWKSITV
jgi:hypothetical protein